MMIKCEDAGKVPRTQYVIAMMRNMNGGGWGSLIANEDFFPFDLGLPIYTTYSKCVAFALTLGLKLESATLF